MWKLFLLYDVIFATFTLIEGIINFVYENKSLSKMPGFHQKGDGKNVA